MKGALIALCVVLGLTLASAQTTIDCGKFKRCSMCVTDLHCGWCESTKSCIEGVTMGPLSPSANCTTWDYAFCSGEPCSSYTTQDACTGDPFCGWCGSSYPQVCAEGNAKGPLFGKCEKWDFSPAGGCGSEGCGVASAASSEAAMKPAEVTKPAGAAESAADAKPAAEAAKPAAAAAEAIKAAPKMAAASSPTSEMEEKKDSDNSAAIMPPSVDLVESSLTGPVQPPKAEN